VARVNKLAFPLPPFTVPFEEKRAEPCCMLVESVEANVDDERVEVTFDSTLLGEARLLGMSTDTDKDTCSALVPLLLRL